MWQLKWSAVTSERRIIHDSGPSDNRQPAVWSVDYQKSTPTAESTREDQTGVFTVFCPSLTLQSLFFLLFLGHYQTNTPGVWFCSLFKQERHQISSPQNTHSSGSYLRTRLFVLSLWVCDLQSCPQPVQSSSAKNNNKTIRPTVEQQDKKHFWIFCFNLFWFYKGTGSCGWFFQNFQHLINCCFLFLS